MRKGPNQVDLMAGQREAVMMDWERVATKRALRLPVHTSISTWQPESEVEAMLVEVESYVLRERLVGDTKRVRKVVPVETPMRFPASPWQFFKQRHQTSWWLGWLVRRRPVRTRLHSVTRSVTFEAEVTFERYATYPEATVYYPPDRLGKPVLVERFTTGVSEV